jgi:hypothetical protein
LNEINMRFYGAEYNNIERGEAKFKWSNWFITYGSILLLILKFYENFEFLKKKIEILRNFWNFQILWNFLTYWLAKSNFCAIKNHIALSWHVISFTDFARECNMIIYCTEIAFC